MVRPGPGGERELKAGDLIAVYEGDDVRFYSLVPVPSRTCARCGTVFPVRHERQVYCEERCRWAAQKRRYRHRVQAPLADDAAYAVD